MIFPPPITGMPELDAYLSQIYMEGTVSNTDNVVINPDNGQVYNPTTGIVVSYLYEYIHIKYADNNVGAGLSDSPTNKAYVGLFNSDSVTESTNPADYTWYIVNGGFGTTNFLWYIVNGGRQFNYIISPTLPNALYVQDTGSVVDLDLVSSSNGSSARIAYAEATIGSLSSSPAFINTSGSSSYPPTNTWGGSEVWVGSPPTLSIGQALYRSDGIYNPTTNITTWYVPYEAALSVGSLEVVSPIMGNIYNGSVVRSGTTISSGLGVSFEDDGSFALGDSAKSIVFDGAALTLNGDLVNTNNLATNSVTTAATNTNVSNNAAVTLSLTAGDTVFANANCDTEYPTTTVNTTRTFSIFITGAATATLSTTTSVVSQITSTNYFTSSSTSGIYVAPSTGSYTFTATYSAGSAGTSIQAIVLKR
jgi:hypothetical protein